MQASNSSPLKVPLGPPIPSSPSSTSFQPRREFLPNTPKKPLSTFSLLTFTSPSSIRLAAFPQSTVQALHRFFESRKVLKLFRDNHSPAKDKEDIEHDRPLQSERPEEEELAEFVLVAKYWANHKAVETEKLLIQILVLLNSLGYAFLSSIDFAREPADKLTLVFERPSASPSPPFAHQPNGSTVSHQSPTPIPPGNIGHPHTGSTGSSVPHQNSTGSTQQPSNGTGIQQQLFGVSFTSQTSFRCICPPLESTPGILQALRNAWPKGVESENKLCDGVYEFKLKGYAFFSDDTFQTDSLALILSLLNSLQKLQFGLVASISLSNSHHKSKDLWLFTTTDTDSLTPHQLLNSIQSSPTSYTLPSGSYVIGANGKEEKKFATLGVGVGTGTVPMGHSRSASAETTPSAFAPSHQRHPTAPTTLPGASMTLSPTNTITSNTGGAGRAGKQGSVLVKKGGRHSPNPGAREIDGNVTPPGSAGLSSSFPGGGKGGVTPPKSPTPPVQTQSPSPTPPGAKMGPMQQGKQMVPLQQPQQVLYSTSTGGNVLYSTPASPPPPASPNPNINISPPSQPSTRPASTQTLKTTQKPNTIDLPPSNPIDDDGSTPPLLSSTAFRDTMLDKDRSTMIEKDRERDTTTASVLSGRSGDSFDVPVMWTGTGALGGLGRDGALGGIGEEDESEEAMRSPSPEGPSVPGGWVDETASTGGKLRGKKEKEKEKERTVDAKVDGAHIINVSSPNSQHGHEDDVDVMPPGGLLSPEDLQRRKSQEATVHTLPIIDTRHAEEKPKEEEKRDGEGGRRGGKDGWVMVNVSGSGSNLTNKFPKDARRTPEGSTHGYGHGHGTTSPSPFPNSNDGSGAVASGEESSSSHDRKDSSKPGSITGTKSKSGFRRLFGRSEKEKDKVSAHNPLNGVGKRTRLGSITISPGKVARRSTID